MSAAPRTPGRATTADPGSAERRPGPVVARHRAAHAGAPLAPGPARDVAALVDALTLALGRRDLAEVERLNLALMQALPALSAAGATQAQLAAIGRALRAGGEAIARGHAATQRALGALLGPSATYSAGAAGNPSTPRTRRHVAA